VKSSHPELGRDGGADKVLESASELLQCPLLLFLEMRRGNVYEALEKFLLFFVPAL
jgi:hypothetical protein